MIFEIKNLQYSISGKVILKEMNLKLDNSNHLLIQGPSGSGKTTLLNLMSGLLKPDSGDILFKNKNLSNLEENEVDLIRSENFGFIFQKLHLIGHLNVKQNINLVRKKKSQNADNILESLGLLNKDKQLAKYLSFGEAQRVAIARGIANNPKVIFADEPTSSLDDSNTRNVMNLIFNQARRIGSTLIVCSHDNRINKYFKNFIKL
jgi:putative ABC transport system ATP-binding protein